MPHHTTRDILGRAAYMRRSCELLLGQLGDLDRSFSGTEPLTPMQEAEIEKSSVQHAERASEHLDLAIQYIEDWNKALNEAFIQVIR
jgi:hypothetical protein